MPVGTFCNLDKQERKVPLPWANGKKTKPMGLMGVLQASWWAVNQGKTSASDSSSDVLELQKIRPKERPVPTVCSLELQQVLFRIPVNDSAGRAMVTSG